MLHRFSYLRFLEAFVVSFILRRSIRIVHIRRGDDDLRVNGDLFAEEEKDGESVERDRGDKSLY